MEIRNVLIKILGLASLSVISCLYSVAQTVVSGGVSDVSGEALPGCTVIFVKADSVVGGVATDSKGKFQLKGLEAGDYECRVSIIGYKPASQRFMLSEKTKLPLFILEQDSKVLDEVTVSADARELTKERAGMSIYYLSERAKNESNVYDALKEIPRLFVDPVGRKIQLDDLRSPLILVNGIKKTLSAVDPKTIESVEVIDNPSARYRGDIDVTAVLNIKIRKDVIQPYLRGEAGVISMLNNNFMWGEGTLETGSATSSFYTNAVYEQIKHTRKDRYSDITQGNLHRVETGTSRGYWDNPSVRIGGDKEFSKKNYIAYNAEYAASTLVSNTTGTGTVTDIDKGEESALQSRYWSKTPYRGFTGNLYYKHTFMSDRTLEFDGKYAYSKNNSYGGREDNSTIYSYTGDIDLYNTRHSGRMDINYSDMFSASAHFEAGSNTEYSVTDIDDRVDAFPMFRYRRTQEYLYAGIDNNRSESRFNYVVSLGLDMVFTNASGVRHSYVDFVPSASLAYKLTKRQSLKFAFSRSRYLPATNYLNPRNISTDSLKVIIGNPMLGPSHNNNFRLDHVFSARRIRMNTHLQYTQRTDLIQPNGYMENDVYVSTYQNFGHAGVFDAGIDFSYTMPCGYIGISPFFSKEYIKGMPFNGNRFGLVLNSSVYYRKVSVDAFFSLVPARSYSLYTKEVTGPMSSRVHVVWRPVQSWAFTFTAQQFLYPRAHSKTWTYNDGYRAYTSTVDRSQSPRIAVGVWYSFVSRNFKWRNKKSFDRGDRDLENIKAQ